MLEYLENNPSVFYAIFLLIVLYVGFNFLIGGRRTESRFPKVDRQNVIFRERGASGHSKASIRTKYGGASKVLDVVVTDTELWLKGILPMFSFIGSKYDLLHKVHISDIKMVEARGSAVELRFMNENGEESHIELILKNPAAFIGAVNG